MTEFHQPINPMRISIGNDSERYQILVFAIAISNSHDVEYLTINGDFISEDRVSLVEICINGQWTT